MDTLKSASFIILSAVCAILAILKAAGVGNPSVECLYFLGVAGVLLIIERVNKFSVNKDGVSADFTAKLEALGAKVSEQVNQVNAKVSEKVNEVSEKVGEVMEGNKVVMSHCVGGRKTKSDAFKLKKITHTDDPQKDRFGGKSAVNDRKISAIVVASKYDDDNFLINLKVESTNPNNPLKGYVTYYLHDTFPNDVRKQPVVDGVSTLKLMAYGAFTVGVVADDGKTLLELDLADNKSFPRKFIEN